MSPLSIVPCGVARLHSDPLRDRSVLFHFLRQLHLGSERFDGTHACVHTARLLSTKKPH